MAFHKCSYSNLNVKISIQKDLRWESDKIGIEKVLCMITPSFHLGVVKSANGMERKNTTS